MYVYIYIYVCVCMYNLHIYILYTKTHIMGISLCMKIQSSVRLETRRETLPAGCCFNTQWVPGTRGSLRRPWLQFSANQLVTFPYFSCMWLCKKHVPNIGPRGLLLRQVHSTFWILEK